MGVGAPTCAAPLGAATGSSAASGFLRGARPRYARAMPTYDMHLQPLAPSVQRATRKPIGFGYTPAIATAGFQKLMDQYMRVLLTPKGSDPCDLNIGTGAWDLRGSTVTPEHAVEILSNCVSDCNQQFRAAQEKQLGKPNDEILEDARITRSVADPSGPGVAVWITVTNRAGQSTVVLLPDLVALAEDV